MERVPARKAVSGNCVYLSEGHPRVQSPTFWAPKAGMTVQHSDAGGAGARPDAGRAGQHRRAGLVGPHGAPQGSWMMIVDARVPNRVLDGMGLDRAALGRTRRKSSRRLMRHAHSGRLKLARGRRAGNSTGSSIRATRSSRGWTRRFDDPARRRSYGEHFDIPATGRAGIHFSWFEGGEVFRSGLLLAPRQG